MAAPNPSLNKTKLCTRWQEEGSCYLGSACKFAHGTDELRVRDAHKKNKMILGAKSKPPSGDTRSDSMTDLKPKPALFKTQLCTRFLQGPCFLGGKCKFAHGSHELVKRDKDVSQQGDRIGEKNGGGVKGTNIRAGGKGSCDGEVNGKSKGKGEYGGGGSENGGQLTGRGACNDIAASISSSQRAAAAAAAAAAESESEDGSDQDDEPTPGTLIPGGYARGDHVFSRIDRDFFEKGRILPGSRGVVVGVASSSLYVLVRFDCELDVHLGPSEFQKAPVRLSSGYSYGDTVYTNFNHDLILPIGSKGVVIGPHATMNSLINVRFHEGIREKIFGVPLSQIQRTFPSLPGGYFIGDTVYSLIGQVGVGASAGKDIIPGSRGVVQSFGTTSLQMLLVLFESGLKVNAHPHQVQREAWLPPGYAVGDKVASLIEYTGTVGPWHGRTIECGSLGVVVASSNLTPHDPAKAVVEFGPNLRINLTADYQFLPAHALGGLAAKRKAAQESTSIGDEVYWMNSSDDIGVVTGFTFRGSITTRFSEGSRDADLQNLRHVVYATKAMTFNSGRTVPVGTAGGMHLKQTEESPSNKEESVVLFSNGIQALVKDNEVFRNVSADCWPEPRRQKLATRVLALNLPVLMLIEVGDGDDWTTPNMLVKAPPWVCEAYKQLVEQTDPAPWEKRPDKADAAAAERLRLKKQRKRHAQKQKRKKEDGEADMDYVSVAGDGGDDGEAETGYRQQITMEEEEELGGVKTLQYSPQEKLGSIDANMQDIFPPYVEPTSSGKNLKKGVPPTKQNSDSAFLPPPPANNAAETLDNQEELTVAANIGLKDDGIGNFSSSDVDNNSAMEKPGSEAKGKKKKKKKDASILLDSTSTQQAKVELQQPKQESQHAAIEAELHAAIDTYLLSPERPVDVEAIVLRRAIGDFPELCGNDDDDDDDDDEERIDSDDDDNDEDGASSEDNEEENQEGGNKTEGDGSIFSKEASDNYSSAKVDERSSGRLDDEERSLMQVQMEAGKELANSLWEVELTDPVIKWMTKTRRRNPRVVKNAMRVLLTLATGYWNERNHKRLTGPKVPLFEANLSKGSRILWEQAVCLSERLNSFKEVTGVERKSTVVYVQTIRVWAVVEDHDKLKREIEQVERSHLRGQGCLVQADLIPIHAAPTSISTRDADGVKQRVPQTFSVIPSKAKTSSDGSGGGRSGETDQNKKHYHLGSSNPNEYSLIKFYSFNAHMLGCLFGNKRESSLPFKMTSKEYEVARLNPSKPCGILLMGRSGTGKTSVQCYRLACDWVDYWRAASVDGDPRLELFGDKEGLFNGQSSSAVLSPAAAAADNNDDVANNESRESVSTKIEAQENRRFVHLRQLFVTKSMCLRGEVQRVSRDLMRGSGETSAVGGAPNAVSDEEGVKGLETAAEEGGGFSNVPPSRFPLFATLSEFLLLLDRTLPGTRFVPLDSSSNSRGEELSGLEAYFENNEEDGDDASDLENDDEYGEGGRGDGEKARMGAEGASEGPRREMTWVVFLNTVWRRLPPKLTKGGVDASLLWTEICSTLKGSVDALKILAKFPGSHEAEERYDALKAQYVSAGRKTSAILKEERERMWDLFCAYEKTRKEERYYDNNDLVADLYRRLCLYGRCGVYFHRLYIDEVQDFTMAEIYLLFQFTDPNCSFLAGDTAQTIARGVGFRFSDLRSLFTRMNEDMQLATTPSLHQQQQHHRQCQILTPTPYSLVTSYRSHVGVLRLASSVVEVIYKFFPRAIDNVGLDRGLFEGPKPKLLLVESIAELTVMLLGQQRSTTGRIDFGSEQVILVRDDASRKALPSSLAESAIVLTVFEAKGLEFNDVLLWDFFGDSPANKEWRLLYSYWDDLANRRLKQKNVSLGLKNGFPSTPSVTTSKADAEEVRSESFDTMAGGGVCAATEQDEMWTSPSLSSATDLKEENTHRQAGTVPSVLPSPLASHQRALPFEEGKFSLLESELKALYCAITRARINVWICDFDKEKRDPVYRWFTEAGLADAVTPENAVQISVVGSSADQKSGPREFQKRGLHFRKMAFNHENPEGLLETALTCFRLAGATDLEANTTAELEAVRAVELSKTLTPSSKGNPGKASGKRAHQHHLKHRVHPSTTSSLSVSVNPAAVERALLVAATQCLRIGGTAFTAKLSATLLLRAKRFALAGAVFESLGQGVDDKKKRTNPVLLEKAAKAFEKAGLAREQGRCLFAAGRTEKAEEIFRRNRLWADCVAAADSLGITPPADLLLRHARALLKTRAQQQQPKHESAHHALTTADSVNDKEGDEASSASVTAGALEAAPTTFEAASALVYAAFVSAQLNTPTRELVSPSPPACASVAKDATFLPTVSLRSPRMLESRLLTRDAALALARLPSLAEALELLEECRMNTATTVTYSNNENKDKSSSSGGGGGGRVGVGASFGSWLPAAVEILLLLNQKEAPLPALISPEVHPVKEEVVPTWMASAIARRSAAEMCVRHHNYALAAAVFASAQGSRCEASVAGKKAGDTAGREEGEEDVTSVKVVQAAQDCAWAECVVAATCHALASTHEFPISAEAVAETMLGHSPSSGFAPFLFPQTSSSSTTATASSSLPSLPQPAAFQLLLFEPRLFALSSPTSGDGGSGGDGGGEGSPRQEATSTMRSVRAKEHLVATLEAAEEVLAMRQREHHLAAPPKSSGSHKNKKKASASASSSVSTTDSLLKSEAKPCFSTSNSWLRARESAMSLKARLVGDCKLASDAFELDMARAMGSQASSSRAAAVAEKTKGSGRPSAAAASAADAATLGGNDAIAGEFVGEAFVLDAWLNVEGSPLDQILGPSNVRRLLTVGVPLVVDLAVALLIGCGGKGESSGSSSSSDGGGAGGQGKSADELRAALAPFAAGAFASTAGSSSQQLVMPPPLSPLLSASLSLVSASSASSSSPHLQQQYLLSVGLAYPLRPSPARSSNARIHRADVGRLVATHLLAAAAKFLSRLAATAHEEERASQHAKNSAGEKEDGDEDEERTVESLVISKVSELPALTAVTEARAAAAAAAAARVAATTRVGSAVAAKGSQVLLELSTSTVDALAITLLLSRVRGAAAAANIRLHAFDQQPMPPGNTATASSDSSKDWVKLTDSVPTSPSQQTQQQQQQQQSAAVVEVVDAENVAASLFCCDADPHQVLPFAAHIAACPFVASAVIRSMVDAFRRAVLGNCKGVATAASTRAAALSSVKSRNRALNSLHSLVRLWDTCLFSNALVAAASAEGSSSGAAASAGSSISAQRGNRRSGKAPASSSLAAIAAAGGMGQRSTLAAKSESANKEAGEAGSDGDGKGAADVRDLFEALVDEADKATTAARSAPLNAGREGRHHASSTAAAAGGGGGGRSEVSWFHAGEVVKSKLPLVRQAGGGGRESKGAATSFEEGGEVATWQLLRIEVAEGAVGVVVEPLQSDSSRVVVEFAATAIKSLIPPAYDPVVAATASSNDTTVAAAETSTIAAGDGASMTMIAKTISKAATTSLTKTTTKMVVLVKNLEICDRYSLSHLYKRIMRSLGGFEGPEKVYQGVRLLVEFLDTVAPAAQARYSGDNPLCRPPTPLPTLVSTHFSATALVSPADATSAAVSRVDHLTLSGPTNAPHTPPPLLPAYAPMPPADERAFVHLIEAAAIHALALSGAMPEPPPARQPRRGDKQPKAVTPPRTSVILPSELVARHLRDPLERACLGEAAGGGSRKLKLALFRTLSDPKHTPFSTGTARALANSVAHLAQLIARHAIVAEASAVAAVVGFKARKEASSSAHARLAVVALTLLANLPRVPLLRNASRVAALLKGALRRLLEIENAGVLAVGEMLTTSVNSGGSEAVEEVPASRVAASVLATWTNTTAAEESLHLLLMGRRSTSDHKAAVKGAARVDKNAEDGSCDSSSSSSSSSEEEDNNSAVKKEVSPASDELSSGQQILSAETLRQLASAASLHLTTEDSVATAIRNINGKFTAPELSRSGFGWPVSSSGGIKIDDAQEINLDKKTDHQVPPREHNQERPSRQRDIKAVSATNTVNSVRADGVEPPPLVVALEGSEVAEENEDAIGEEAVLSLVDLQRLEDERRDERDKAETEGEEQRQSALLILRSALNASVRRWKTKRRRQGAQTADEREELEVAKTNQAELDSYNLVTKTQKTHCSVCKGGVEVNGDATEKHFYVVRTRPLHDTSTVFPVDSNGFLAAMYAPKIVLPFHAAMNAEQRIGHTEYCQASTFFNGQERALCFEALLIHRTPCTVRVATVAGQKYAKLKFTNLINFVLTSTCPGLKMGPAMFSLFEQIMESVMRRAIAKAVTLDTEHQDISVDDIEQALGLLVSEDLLRFAKIQGDKAVTELGGGLQRAEDKTAVLAEHVISSVDLHDRQCSISASVFLATAIEYFLSEFLMVTNRCAEQDEEQPSGSLGFSHFLKAMKDDGDLGDLILRPVIEFAESMANAEQKGVVPVQGHPFYFDVVVDPLSLIALSENPENTAFFDINFHAYWLQYMGYDKQLAGLRQQREKEVKDLQVQENEYTSSTISSSLVPGVVTRVAEDHPSPQELQLLELCKTASSYAEMWGYSSRVCRNKHHYCADKGHLEATRLLDAYRAGAEVLALAKKASAIVANRRLSTEVDSWRTEEKSEWSQIAAQEAYLDEADQSMREATKLIDDMQELLARVRTKQLYVTTATNVSSMVQKRAQALGAAAQSMQDVLARIRTFREKQKQEQANGNFPRNLKSADLGANDDEDGDDYEFSTLADDDDEKSGCGGGSVAGPSVPTDQDVDNVPVQKKNEDKGGLAQRKKKQHGRDTRGNQKPADSTVKGQRGGLASRRQTRTEKKRKKAKGRGGEGGGGGGGV